MTFEWLSALRQRATELAAQQKSAERSNVLSILNVTLFGLLTAFCGVLAISAFADNFNYDVLWALFIIIALVTIGILAAYFISLFRDPNLLRSESYNLTTQSFQYLRGSDITQAVDRGGLVENPQTIVTPPDMTRHVP